MKYLFIGEKPSLTREVNKVYDKHKDEIIKRLGEIDFIPLSGHVCKFFEPDDYEAWKNIPWGDIDYPIIPERWGIKANNDKWSLKTLSEIKQTARNYDGLICGTDSDVEGYGIFFNLESFLKLADMKVLRFMESSLTENEILKSLLSMTDYHKDPLHIRNTKSYLIRARADWLYGMNATRMMSSKMPYTMKVGRVKAPTIKLVYDNSLEIENFKPRNFFVVEANYGTFKGYYTEDDKQPKQFDHKEEIPSYDLNGVLLNKQKKRVSTAAPKLYDLASIQIEAGQQFGYAPAQTLNIIQDLYEKHKVISYPRTQCRYVSYEKSKEFGMMLRNIAVFDDLAEIAANVSQETIEKVRTNKNVVNDIEVQKESHDALLPTATRPDLSKLNEDEQNICKMIYKRLLAQFLPPLTEDKTIAIIDHNGKHFIARGSIVINQGWRILYKNSKDNILPNFEKGDAIKAEEIVPVERTTKPPARLTEATLLNEMVTIAKKIEDKELRQALAESKGIGTSSTRAKIIKDIISSGYVEVKKNGLYITNIGRKYVESLKSLDIISPFFAAIIDTKIKDVQRGDADYKDTYNDIIKDLYNMCKQIEGIPSTKIILKQRCPKCSTNFTEEQHSYTCHNCGFKINKEILGKKITPEILDTLLSGKATPTYTLKKKDGTEFKSSLILNEDGIVFSGKSGITCPLCKTENIRKNNGGVFCDCGFKLFRKFRGHEFTDSELKKLCAGKTLPYVELTKKEGGTYTANVYLNDSGEVNIDFGGK